MKKFIFLAMLIIAVGILSGCQNAAEKAAETAIEQSTNGQADVDVDNNSMTVNTDSGSLTVGETATIPDDFPSDVYVIDGTVKSSLTLDDSSTYQLQIESSESYADTVDTYKEELANEGWNITSSMEISGVTSLIAEKDNRSTTVNISESDGIVNLMLSTSVLED